MKKTLVIGAALLTLSSSAFAKNTGCGLGWAVFGGDASSTLGQIFQITTNHLTSSQAFGITSGTSGCSQPRSMFVSNETMKFVNDNMDKLALDISSGQGETLETLATLLKIEDKAAFSATLQANFENIYTSENVTSANVLDNIAKVVG